MGSRMRITRGATGSRRSHHKAAKPRLAEDKAGDLHVRHHVSPTSGMYKGRQIIDTSKRDARLHRKEEEKRQARAGKVDDSGAEDDTKQKEELDPAALSKK